MYFLLTIACLLLTAHVNGSKMLFFDDDTYNPCQAGSGVYFYPDNTDAHKYYQCDESNNAFERSCGNLVWDDIRMACNWPSAVAPPPSKINPTEKTTPWSTTPPSWPTTPPSWLTTTPSWPTTTSSWPTTTSSWPSTTVASLPSLCAPIDPCGEHGSCIESPETVPDSARRFACICSENWFGRTCERHISELTTPAPPVFDQNSDMPQTMNTSSLPVNTEEDSKDIFYGLTAGSQVGHYKRPQKRTADSKLIKL